MTDAKREFLHNGLVATFPGDTREDKLLSMILYTARELIPADTSIKHGTISLELNTGKVITIIYRQP